MSGWHDDEQADEQGDRAQPPAVSTDCNCDEAVAELWEYLDSELVPAEADRVRAHLENCHGCLAEHDVELVVKQLVRRCFAGDDAAPVQLRAKIHATLTTLRITSITTSTDL